MNRDNRIQDLASKHGFSAEATEFIAAAIKSAGGRFAHWKHPDLGGFGQWVPGMTTLAPRDPALETRLDKLCLDVLSLLRASGHPDIPGQDDSPVWWPKTLGLQPDAAGGQNQVRYAYFAGPHRLAVDRGDGRVTVYDTGDHRVHGVSQAAGAGDGLVFSSQRGEASLDALTVVEPPGD